MNSHYCLSKNNYITRSKKLLIHVSRWIDYRILVCNTTFENIGVISWRSVWENKRTWIKLLFFCKSLTLARSDNITPSLPRHGIDENSKILEVIVTDFKGKCES